jgi:hypothetical protein
MFFLLFLLVIWTVSIVGGVVVASVPRIFASRFTLHRAYFVVASFHHTPESLRRVDVSHEMRELGRSPTKLKFMPFLQTKAMRGDLREALDTCRESASEGARVRRSPMCFLDVTYTVGWAWRKRTKVHRCLFPIYSFSDYVHYPPTCPWLHWGRPAASASGVESAVLTLRSSAAEGHSSQLSCNVTARVQTLKGPSGDFHCNSAEGYQLRKHILRVVLLPDILVLSKALEGSEESAGPMGTGSTGSGSAGEASTNSLKSLVLRPAVSVRLHVKLGANRTEVMVL